ncbi:hypothetical protein ACHQM5_028890 [Ranunculus cassubicifolius]
MSAAATISFTSYGHLQGSRIRSHSSPIPRIQSATKHLSSNTQHLCLHKINGAGRVGRRLNMQINAVNLPPVPSVPSGSSFPGWVLLTIIPMLIPLLTGGGKVGALKVLKNRVDSTLATVATIAEQIEDVAETVDKIADEVVDHLPQGSKLRKIVEMIDVVAETTVKGADYAEDLLQKVDDMGDAVEAMLEESSKVKSVEDKDQISMAITQASDETKEIGNDQVAATTTVADEEKKEY